MSLVQWVVREKTDKLLDPSCGDGATLEHHKQSRGIESDPYWAWRARERSPHAIVTNEDFFGWAAHTDERFECAAGNPPFVRFQNFKGIPKAAATSICKANGAETSGLSSAWAAFLVATTSLLNAGGRMAFVVPAEIGHATYAVPIVEYLLRSFSVVHVIAIREKLFPRLSEDCWLLYCEGRGGNTQTLTFTSMDRFEATPTPPPPTHKVRWPELKKLWKGRLRNLLISEAARSIYQDITARPESHRLGNFARVGIGYITGDNDFFHLSRSAAAEHGIPEKYLLPTVRRGRSLERDVIDEELLSKWNARDEACYLLHIPPTSSLPAAVQTYLDSQHGMETRTRYKCRVRSTWYTVPGVMRPDYFLQYMSGKEVALARNDLGASCTNSVHAVQLTNRETAANALHHWSSSFTKLSCELEGHPLGGGMLKLEPREASSIVFATAEQFDLLIDDALETMKRWRHIPAR